MTGPSPLPRRWIGPGWRAAGLGLMLTAVSLLSTPFAGAASSPWREEPQRFVLNSGQVCLYQRDASSPITVVELFLPAGKNAVPAGKDGLAYLTTRLTLEIPDSVVAQEIMAQATRLRLSVFEDCSAISLECLSENLGETLRVAGEIIQNPLFSGRRIDENKKVMSIYARAEDDDIVGAGHAAAMRALFRGQGYGSAVYGTEASLRAIVKKDITSFYSRFFVRTAVVFSVCSDLEWARVRPLLERAFGQFPARPPGAASPAEASLPESREVFQAKDAKQTYVGRAFLLPPASAADFAKGFLLEVLLGVGPGSRLWELRASAKLAYNVGARTTWTKGCGVLEAYLETGNEKKGRAIVALDGVLKELHDKGLLADEFAMTKSLARAHLLRSLEGKKSRAQMMGLWQVLGLGLEAFTGVFDSLEAVRLEDMNSFIRDRLDLGRSILISVGGGKAGS